MTLIFLISTFILSSTIIKHAKNTDKHFFHTPLLVTTPPLILLIYVKILLNLNLLTADRAQPFIPIIDEISIIYCNAILFFSLLILLSRAVLPPLLIAKNQKIPSTGTLIIVFLFFKSNEFILSFFGSVQINILVSELSQLSFILLLSSVIIRTKLNKSIFKFFIISVITITTYFLFTFDKGYIISLFSSIFLVLLGTKNFNLNLTLLKTNLIIIGGSILLPILNFLEGFFFYDYGNPFKSLGEIGESNLVLNYFHIKYNPFCNYDYTISISESLISPFKALLGMDMTFHSDKFIEICFPEQISQGATMTFGLISESVISKELPPFLFYSLAAIIFIIILEFFYYRFSLAGLLIYSQSIEIIYKLIRTSVSLSIFNLLFTIVAAFIVSQTIEWVNSYFSSKKLI